MKRWISNIAAVLWFFGVLIWMLLMLPITLIMLPSDITYNGFRFGTQPIGFTFCWYLVRIRNYNACPCLENACKLLGYILT